MPRKQPTVTIECKPGESRTAAIMRESVTTYVEHVASHPATDRPFAQGNANMPDDLTPAQERRIGDERYVQAMRADEREWLFLTQLAQRWNVDLASVVG